MDLKKVAEEQKIKLEKEREEIKEQIKAAKEAAAAAPPPEAPAVIKPVAKGPEPNTGKYEGCNLHTKQSDESANNDAIFKILGGEEEPTAVQSPSSGKFCSRDFF